MASVPPTRIRKDVYRLAAGDRTLDWYGRAINEMKRRPINDPTSWRYQAAIHGYNRQQDPFARPTDTLPSTAEQQQFWNQCQHSSWYFLPWHRGYLIYFERICLGHIIRLGGPRDWALPYWNYSAPGSNPNQKLIPPAFRQQTVGGQPNPLFVANRNGGSTGNAGIDPAEVSLDCLKRTRFIGTAFGGSPGFGGPQTGFNHGGGPTGACELTPHGDIHVAVGGLMGGFNTAGLDPLFWLHHANIDRLWEIWRLRPSSLGDPTSSAWRDFAFALHDQNGAVVSFRSSQMTSTVANGYRYQDVSSPFPAGESAAVPGSVEESTMEEKPGDDGAPRTAELAGATQESVPLGGGRSSARVEITAPPRATRESAGAAPPRTFLNIENITGSGPPGNYAVYVNVPEGGAAEDHPGNLVGTLPLFGIEEASSQESSHGGSGLTHVLEITELVQRLQGEGRWNETDIDVEFVPLRPVPEGSDVRIGRISVYHG